MHGDVRSPVLRLTAIFVAALLVLACAVGRQGQSGAPQPPSEQSASPGKQEDGTMTIEEFERDANGAVAVAERYWSARFANSGQRFNPVRRVITYERGGEVNCGREAIPGNNAVYCPDGDFIAYDVDWAVVAFRRVGDAFLFYLLGHEYAHAVQVRLGIQYRYTIQQELQADCLAGAMIGDSVRGGELTLDDGDLDEFRSGLLAVGDDPDQPWFSPGAHGTAEQRTEAFFEGYERSVDACLD
jgi:predicted metalloprotease